ncbi:hypothetical protein B0T26DRAFT_189011 [Lasiosphaeria miniovina]|uniref:Uncharacterized protein n=1 Tax=Lasiosphaeria miniovina TaxID=1954250 RepID=A0AA40ATA0_9PEZI|nr:uncharacterized protein B0T26DRAFT_189011 [Lasiosphaeria miniovina]KAK0721618.1 hypothetical protein B0T26DRAFT_189011 [Lasiosphaeria miniovina]
MADPLGLPPNQFATLLNAFTSIDQRLSRIEAGLRLNSSSSSSSFNFAPAAPAVQVPPPPHNAPPPVSLNSATGPTAIVPVAFRSLEPPPQGYAISSRATMQEELDQWTIPRGYSMRIAGAKVTGKKKAKNEGRRKPTTDRLSKKCGCLFKFEVIETTKGSDIWVLHYPNEEHKVHNHGPSDQTSDPRARKLPSYMSAEVDQWLREGWQVSKIQEELKGRGFTNVLNTDLYNRKRLLKKDEGHMLG